jgi:hypothetical protein
MHRRLLLAVVLLAAPLLMAPESTGCPDCLLEDSGIVDGGSPRDAGHEPALHSDASVEASDSGSQRVVPGAVLVQEPVGCACSAVR